MSVGQGVFHALSLAPNSLPAMASLAQKNSTTVSSFFQKEQCIIFESASKSSHFFPPMYMSGLVVLFSIKLWCFCFQPLKYASSASLYQQEGGSPALTASTQTGVNSKVSAWLQQTHDIDATSNGAFDWLIDCPQVTECVNLLRDLKRKYVWVVFLNTCITICVSELARCQLELTELAQLIQRLHWLEGGLPITSTDLEMRISMHVSIEYVGYESDLSSVCPQLLHSLISLFKL